MYAIDPLARTLCFSDGKEGMVFTNTTWVNRCSDLSFAGSNLVSGIEIDRLAAIVDLGTADELSAAMALRTHKEAEPASLPYIFRATKSWS